MPELPEVETVRLQLKHKIVKRTIARVEVFHQKTVAHDQEISKKLKGKTIADIDRVGKLMIFHFKDENNLFLLAHLKMTGQFFFVDKKGQVVGGGHSLPEHFRFSSHSTPEKLGPMTAANTKLPTKHTRVAFHFVDSTTLYFNDMRLFGYTKLADAGEVAIARSKYGPEPIHKEFDTESFQKKIRTKKTSVKAALLNQSFVAGLGNIYVDEALWRAKVKPMRRADTLTKKEAIEIARHAGEVMNESIKVGGTTFQHFEDTDGKKGNFTNHLQVFGKQKTPCPRCGAIILKTKTAGRGTHYCPMCQK